MYNHHKALHAVLRNLLQAAFLVYANAPTSNKAALHYARQAHEYAYEAREMLRRGDRLVWVVSTARMARRSLLSAYRAAPGGPLYEGEQV